MKKLFDEKWVEQNAECAAGLAWGRIYAGAGRELEDALQGFERADWLLWFCVKNEIFDSNYVEYVLGLALNNLPSKFARARALVLQVQASTAAAAAVRVDAGTEAFTASSLGKLAEAHAFEAAGFVAMMMRSHYGTDGKALLYAQAALLSLVGAIAGKKMGDEGAGFAHRQLCKQIRATVKRTT